MMIAQKASFGLAKPPGDNQYARVDRGTENPEAPPTLAEAGIDKHLADRARKLAAVPDAEFERLIDELLEGMPKATGGKPYQSVNTPSVLAGVAPTLTDLGLGSKSRGYLTSRRDNSDSSCSRAPGIRSRLASARLTVLCKRSLSAARRPTWPSPLMMSWRIASDRDFAGVLFFACRFIRPPAPPDFAQRSIAASSSGEMRTGITGSRPIGSRPVGMGSPQMGFVMTAEWQKWPRCGITKTRADYDAVIEEKRLRGQAR